jgi:hypothetical protein
LKRQQPNRRLILLKDAEYALDHSGSMIFLYALFIGSHVLNSPPYARTVFALVLLVCLTPKLACSLYRLKGQCNS